MWLRLKAIRNKARITLVVMKSSLRFQVKSPSRLALSPLVGWMNFPQKSWTPSGELIALPNQNILDEEQ